MELVLLLNKLNNEVGFNFKSFRNPSSSINYFVPNTGFAFSQMECSAESFERVGKRIDTKKTENVIGEFNKSASISSTVNTIDDDDRQFKISTDNKLKRKSTILLDEVPKPRKILPKTILFNINNGNIENQQTVSHEHSISSVSLPITTTITSTESIQSQQPAQRNNLSRSDDLLTITTTTGVFDPRHLINPFDVL